jgi:4-amino-4-deoxy-L-arabinose transferase-like glycosyltransferase
MSRKSAQEAKTERTTWFFLVLVFIVLSFDREGTIPDFIVPIVTSIILFVSAFYQQRRRRWRVAPIVWIIATFLGFVGGLAFYLQNLETASVAAELVLTYLNPVLISLAATALIIVMGILTNEG